MRKSKVMLLLALCLSVCLVVCLFAVSCGHKHVYFVKLTEEPTETATGTARETCFCGESHIIEVPALTDTAVWSVQSNTEAGHVKDGSKVYTSDRFGNVTVTVPATGHTAWGEWKITKDPTAEKGGTAQRTCSCNEVEKFTLPSLSDTSFWSVKSTDDPTHSEDGKTVYTSDYGDVTVAIPATGHTEWGEWEITKDPTADKEGTAKRTCSCGEEDIFTLPNLSDTSFWSEKSSDGPTHTENGQTVYTSAYGDVTVTIPAAGHTEWGGWEITKDPTADKEGTAKRTCSCGEEDIFTLPNLSDTSFWSEKSSDGPTHTENGQTVYTSAYGDVTVTIPAAGHTEWGGWEITKDPTADKEGTAKRTCSCGEEDIFTLPNLSDTSFWSESVTSADFTHGTIHTYASAYGTVTVEDDDTVPYPYLGKTYTAVELEASATDGVVRAGISWNTASLTIGEDGLASGTAFPFRNQFKFELVNVATGELRVTTWVYSDTDRTGDSTTCTAWVDMNSGIIIMPRNGNDLTDFFLWTPFESGMSSSAVKASAWQGAMAVAYTFGENTYTVFIQGNRAYFGVSFVDKDGQSVSADACYHAPTLYVKDAEGNTVAGYAFDGDREVPVDGLEGDYTVDGKTLWISGFGTLTYDGQNGTYKKAATDAGYDLHVYLCNAEGVAVKYYQLTFGEERTATLAPDKVNLTFDCGGVCTDPAAVSVDRNIAYTLPVPADTATKLFRGWKLADGTVVGASYVPTADTALTACWITKSTVTLVDVLDGDPTTLYLGVGDTLANALPAYTVDEEGGRLFVGWYIDMNANGAYDKGTDVALDADATIGETELAITVIAVWQPVPPYYGTYYGVELWGSSYGNGTSHKATLTIDATGAMSGVVNGQVVSYDPATQVLVYTKNGTNCTCFFDAENKIFAGIYKPQHIDSDFYVLTSALTDTDFQVTGRTSIKCLDPLGTSTYQGFYIHLFTVKTRNGEKNVCLYADHIYTDITVATTDGTALTVGTAATGKTLVVRDAAGKMIFALASKSGSTIGSNDTVALDAYFGSYTDGADGTVVLDGTGVITWGDKTGTYEKVGDGFAVYILVDGKRTEYYDMTLDTAAGTCQLNKPIVTVTLDAGGKATVENFTDINKNIPIRLPAPEATAYFFRGWYVQGDASQTLVSLDYIPTESVTLVAKWDNKYSLTIHRNNGTDTEVIYYGEGDTMQVDNPVYDGFRFVGWFTSAECTEGTEWTSGVTVTANVEIYAQWAVAPVYTGNYPYCLEFTKEGSGAESYYKRTVNMIIGPDGTGSASSYPVRGNITVQNYNTETGYMEIVVGTTVYSACFDPLTRVIVMNRNAGANKPLDKVYVFVREDTTSSTGSLSSCWDNGATRAITWNAASGTSHHIFIKGGKAYFGVSFLDGADAGTANAIPANECYNASVLFVYDCDGNLISKYGYNGETMKELDGYEGDYTVIGTELTVHVTGYGELTFAGVKGTYEKLPDGTFAVYTYDAEGNINGYHVATLDTAAHTATVQTPTVTVSYVTEYGTQPAQAVVNKNVPLTLPAGLVNDAFIFRGWYVQGDETQTLYQTYTPTAEAVLVAKWDAKVTVTVVYGNGLPNETLAYGVGDTARLVTPPYTAGKCFSHWYTLAPDGVTKVEYTPGTLTESITVYAEWMDAVPQYGDYKYANVFGNTDITRSFKTTFSVAADGTVTASDGFGGTIEQIDETHFKIVSGTKESYFAYDPVSGVMVSAYNSGKSSIGIDINVYVPVAVTDSIKLSQYKHLGSANRVLFSYELDGVKHYGLVWCDNTDGTGAHIWADITWDGSLTASDMWNAPTGTTVHFRQGETAILTITKASSGWTVVTE